MLTAANVHDSTVFEELLDSIGPIKRPGREAVRGSVPRSCTPTKPTMIRSVRRP